MAAAVAGGCASHESPSPAAVSAGKVPNVGHVVISVSPEVASDREARFQKVDGPSKLTAALEKELTSVGRWDPKSPRVMNVVVKQYRLRSGTSVFMLGMMAGGDVLDVAVTVRESDRELASFSTGAGSVASGGFGQESRFDRLAKAVAERVVKQL